VSPFKSRVNWRCPLLWRQARRLGGAGRAPAREPRAAAGRLLRVRLRGRGAEHEAPGLLPPDARRALGRRPHRRAPLRPRPGARHALPGRDLGHPGRSRGAERGPPAASARGHRATREKALFIMSWGRGPRGGRAVPESANVDYPHGPGWGIDAAVRVPLSAPVTPPPGPAGHGQVC
jgi:hypothetical protein